MKRDIFNHPIPSTNKRTRKNGGSLEKIWDAEDSFGPFTSHIISTVAAEFLDH